MTGWRLLDMGPYGAAYNMAVDAVLLRQQGADSPPTLRVYRWRQPSITVGYSTAVARDVDVGRCKSAGISVTRRLTGGGVVIHDGALTFSIVAPAQSTRLPASAQGLHRLAMRTLRRGLGTVGVHSTHAPGKSKADQAGPNWCMTRAYCDDLMTPCGKIAGGAARRTRTGVLYQGYVSLRTAGEGITRAAYPERLRGALGDNASAYGSTSPGAAEHELATAMRAAFEETVGGTSRAELTAQEQRLIQSTAKSVFDAPAWLAGSRHERRALRLVAERGDGRTA